MEPMPDRQNQEQTDQGSYEPELEARRWPIGVLVAAVLLVVGILLVVLVGAPILQGKNVRLAKYRESAAAFVAEREFAKAISMYQRALALQPDDSSIRKLMAHCRFQSGDLPEAIAEYHRCLRIKPDDGQVRLTLASLYLLAKKVDRSREILDALLGSESDNLLALTMEAQCYYELKNSPHPLVSVSMITDILPATASRYNLPAESGAVGASATEEKELLQAVQRSPDEVQPHKNLADFYRRQKRFADAEQEYSKMVEIAPQDPYVHLHLADFYRSEEVARLPEAVEQYSAILRAIDSKNLFALRGISGLSLAAGDLPAAKKYIDRLLLDYPPDAYGRYFRGIMEIYDDDAARATMDFQFVTKEISEYPHAHYLLGYAHLLNHALAKAEAGLEQAARVDPAYGPPLLLLAEIALNRGQFRRALEVIDRLLVMEREKNNPLTHLIHGRIYLSQNEPIRAEAPFTQLSELDKESVYPRLLLGEICKRTGKSDQAVAQYQAAIAADPSSPLPSYLLGLLYERMGEPVLSLANLEDAVRKAPNLALSARSLAYAYIRNSGGDKANAKALGETLLQRFPNNFTLLDILGTIFYERKEFPKAVEVFELIPEQERDARPHIIYHYAMSLYRSGKHDFARRELEKAARWLRTLPKAEDVEKTLDELVSPGGAAE